MKKFLEAQGLFFFAFLFLISLAFTSASEAVCNPQVSLINQDSNPANPGDYVKILFELTGLSNCNGYSVRIDPEYPFLIDANESIVKVIQSNPYAKEAKTSWMISYKLKVDKDAFEGDSYIKLDLKEGGDGQFTGSYQEQSFLVSIEDSRTSFDAVIQDYSSSEVSIAIANVGKYTANSVVVRIPEQEFFSVTGTDGQMVGNIDSGDYTIVGFSISKKASSYIPDSRGENRSSNFQPSLDSSTTKLSFDIYYTDNLGERRIVNMQLPLKVETNSSAMVPFGVGRKSTSNATSKYFWFVLLIIILGILFFVYRKNPQRFDRILSRFKRKKENSLEVPSWIKKAREKEKK